MRGDGAHQDGLPLHRIDSGEAALDGSGQRTTSGCLGQSSVKVSSVGFARRPAIVDTAKLITTADATMIGPGPTVFDD